MRGIARIFGISPATLASWLKKDQSNPRVEQTLAPAEPEDVLELDEIWSFVLKSHKSAGRGLHYVGEHDKSLLL